MVRVVSASEVLRLAPDVDPQAERIIVDGCQSTTDTTRLVAANALGRIAPDHPALNRLASPPTAPPGPTARSVSTMVHGTFARLGYWWRPGDNFFTYIEKGVSANLYNGPDYFRWDGRYRPDARAMGAQDLATWMRKAALAEFDTMYAHSHGGNVVLDAAVAHGVQVKLLVLLSVPALGRPAADWAVIRNRVRRLFAIRVHCDIVILADRSRQVFPSPVRTLNLPVWFDHSAVLSPRVWDRYGLSNEVRAECRLC